MIYRFNSFELDGSEYRLSREQTAIHVKPKVLELLVYLVEHRDRVVGKDELLSTLWEGRFVSDGVLAEAVHEARRALRDDAGKSDFIRTVHGRGYQFVVRTVEVVGGRNESAGAGGVPLYLDWNGGPTMLQPGENFIGRDAACLIVLVGLRVSRRHARIDVSAGSAVVHDLGSKNGTVVNGEKITAPRSLAGGDVIEIGGLALEVRVGLGAASTMTSEGSAGS